MGQYGNIWVWFSSIVSVIALGIVIILRKLGLLGTRGFYITLTLFIFSLIILLLMQFITISNYNNNHVVGSKKAKSETFRIRKRINELLRERPDADVVNWNSGVDGREEIRSFQTFNGVQDFYGVVGALAYNRTWVVIIYSLERNDIIKYMGDPSPQQLEDPFDGFYPDGNKPGMFGQQFGQEGGQSPNGTNIYFGNQKKREQNNSVNDGVQRAYNQLNK